MIRAAVLSVCLLACTLACADDRPALAPGLALELGFEGTCDPIASAAIAVRAPLSGVTFESGIEGRAARFDGSGAELKLRGIDALAIEGSMTLEFFVKPADWKNPYAAGGGLESLVSHSDIFTVAIDPHVWRLQARLKTTANEMGLRLNGGDVRPAAWHHVALVLDGERSQARLVLDGAVVSDVPASGNVAVNPNLDLVVGTWFRKNQAFCGELDSVRLWNRALSDDELRRRAALLPSVPGS